MNNFEQILLYAVAIPLLTVSAVYSLSSLWAEFHHKKTVFRKMKLAANDLGIEEFVDMVVNIHTDLFKSVLRIALSCESVSEAYRTLRAIPAFFTKKENQNNLDFLYYRYNLDLISQRS